MSLLSAFIRTATLFFVVTATLPSLYAAEATTWPRFRGNNGDGIGQLANPPVKWTEQDFAWRTKIPGNGHSSPVLWGQRLFVTSADNKTGERFVLCLDCTDGSILWTKRLPGKAYHTHARNSFATSTPAVDADHVFCCWAVPDKYSLMALDHEGKLVWETELGAYKSQHGFGASPIVLGDLVIVGDEQDGGGSLVGVNTADGSIRWRISRRGKNATYSTPCVYQPSGERPEVIFTNWQHGITSVNPASGNVNWELSVFDVNKNERAIASPIVAGDLVLGTCGFVTAQKHLVAIRPSASRTGTPASEVWRLERAVAYLPTPLFYDGRVYCCSELGIATCLDAVTGKQIWQQRLGGNFSSSPVCTGEHLYCTSNDGTVHVLATGDTYNLVAKNRIGEATQATPAMGYDRIYFRTLGHVVAVGGATPASAPATSLAH
jgi:outer membrane protein assembly factor BamB